MTSNPEYDDEWAKQQVPYSAAPATDQLATALAKAQADFGTIHRDKTVTVTMKSGGRYTFSYAPLESILRAVMPALSANGLALTQSVVTNGTESVNTTLMHSSGQSASNLVRILMKEDERGPQAYGSALTYARRYGITLLLCICADDDDDANAAEGNSAEVTAKPKKALSIAREGDAPVDLKVRDKYIKLYLDALKVDISEENKASGIFQIHEDLNQDHELYRAVWDTFDSKTRSAINAYINKVQPKQMRADGRLG